MPRQIAAIAPVNNTTTKRPTATVKSARRNTIVLNLSPFTTQTRQESTTEYFKLELRGAADCCKLCEAGDHPIRMLHGISDDYVEIAPCRDYFARLKQTAKDVQMTEYPDTWHAFDYPLFPTTPTVVQNGQTTHCVLKEQPVGTIINMATQNPSRMQTLAWEEILM
jgi:hypothetical protein